jgi:hypothetical protein
MDQPPKRRFVAATAGQGGRVEEGNWRVQMSRQWVRELYLEMSWWGPRFADWKKPARVSKGSVNF